MRRCGRVPIYSVLATTHHSEEFLLPDVMMEVGREDINGKYIVTVTTFPLTSFMALRERRADFESKLLALKMPFETSRKDLFMKCPRRSPSVKPFDVIPSDSHVTHTFKWPLRNIPPFFIHFSKVHIGFTFRTMDRSSEKTQLWLSNQHNCERSEQSLTKGERPGQTNTNWWPKMSIREYLEWRVSQQVSTPYPQNLGFGWGLIAFKRIWEKIGVFIQIFTIILEYKNWGGKHMMQIAWTSRRRICA